MFHRIGQINTPVPRRGFQEYPKYVGNVVVQNSAEELAHRAALAEAAAAARAAALAEKLARPPSPAAVRMRRSRDRRREGKRVIRCDLFAAQIEALARAGFLDPAERDDAAEWARVFDRVLDHLARSVQGVTLGARADTGLALSDTELGRLLCDGSAIDFEIARAVAG